MMLASIGNFLIYLVSGLVLLGAFLGAYTLALPMREWELIRQGNVAAAVVVGGALLGFTLPLAEAIRHTDGFGQMVVWSAVALLVQLLGFGLMRLYRRDAAAAIEKGDMAEAVLLASGSLALGLVNAACLT
jgi:putative membrane protein